MPCNIKFIVSPSLQVAVQRVLSRPWFLGRAQLLFGFFWCPNLSNIIFFQDDARCDVHISSQHLTFDILLPVSNRTTREHHGIPVSPAHYRASTEVSGTSRHVPCRLEFKTTPDGVNVGSWSQNTSKYNGDASASGCIWLHLILFWMYNM